MFESLSGRLQDALKSLRGEARLTPELVEVLLREIRLALLEADVNVKVVKAFVDRVRDRALDQTVLSSFTPSQQVVKIVRDEMLALFGDAGRVSAASAPGGVVMLMGLQGTGKTTAAAKLGRWLTTQGRYPMVVSTDVRRPAAIDQLSGLAEQAGVRVYDPAGEFDPVARARGAVVEASHLGCDVIVVDTAGRLHVDDDLMAELETIKVATEPTDQLYVADAMTGQDAIKSAGEFNRRVGVSGVVLSKADGDARGGAALSVVSVVGVPIAFVGNGERLDDLELFHADRIVSRILGMGDVLSLAEKAEQAVSREDADRLERKIRRNEFTLEDFRDQLQAVRRMGPLEQLAGLLPGIGSAKPQSGELDDGQLTQVEAVVNSMTRRERRYHRLIDGSRRRRIARGCGRSVEEVNRVLKRFLAVRKMLQTVGAAGKRRKSGRNVRRGPARGLVQRMNQLGGGS